MPATDLPVNLPEVHPLHTLVHPAPLLAIPDIHGNLSRLERALQVWQTDFADHRLVFLGDLIHRGDDDRRVMNQVRTLRESGKAELLIGNHEAMQILGRLRHQPKLLEMAEHFGEKTRRAYPGGELLTMLQWLNAQLRPVLVHSYGGVQTLFTHARRPNQGEWTAINRLAELESRSATSAAGCLRLAQDELLIQHWLWGTIKKSVQIIPLPVGITRSVHGHETHLQPKIRTDEHGHSAHLIDLGPEGLAVFSEREGVVTLKPGKVNRRKK